jgi:hypothetical protein
MWESDATLDHKVSQSRTPKFLIVLDTMMLGIGAVTDDIASGERCGICWTSRGRRRDAGSGLPGFPQQLPLDRASSPAAEAASTTLRESHCAGTALRTIIASRACVLAWV